MAKGRFKYEASLASRTNVHNSNQSYTFIRNQFCNIRPVSAAEREDYSATGYIASHRLVFKDKPAVVSGMRATVTLKGVVTIFHLRAVIPGLPGDNQITYADVRIGE